MNNFDELKRISEQNSNLMKMYKIAFPTNNILKSLQPLIDNQKKWESIIPKITVPELLLPNITIPNFNNIFSSEFVEQLRRISSIGENFSNNPEVQFAFITDLEVLNIKSTENLKDTLINNLTDKDLQEKETLLDKNLLPLLEEQNLESLWLGANYSLESNNPDKLRHCLVSLRTILEFLIDDKLASNNEIKDNPVFEKEFKKYHSGKATVNEIKIPRRKKIEYFISKFKFGFLEEFTAHEIQYVCDCYAILCNLHQQDVGLTENQVKSLKVKTGITLWLLCYLNKIQETN